MNTELLNRYRDKWKADVNAYYEERKRELDQEHRHALEEIDGFWSGEATENGSSTEVPPVRKLPPNPDKGGAPQSGKLPDGLTRRQVVWEIVTEFSDKTFTQRDVKERYLEKYPAADSPHLRSGISGLLGEMTEKGQLERVGEREKATDPWVYKVREDREANLLGP